MGLFGKKKEEKVSKLDQPAPDGFKLKGETLKPNYLFMDIHKKELGEYLDSMKAKADGIIAQHNEHSEKIQELFKDLPQEHAFWLKTGESLKNLQELYDALHEMDDITYFHHVNPKCNDFSEWVKHMFNDDKLAAALSLAPGKEDAIRAIEKRMSELKLEILGDAAFGDTEVPAPEDKKQKKRFLGIFGKIDSDVKDDETTLRLEVERRKQWLDMKSQEIEKKEQENIKKEKELFEKYKDLQKTEVFREPDVVENTVHDEQRLHAELSKRYQEMDSLITTLQEDITNKRFSEARRLLPEIKRQYDSLDHADTKKHEFYYKIVNLKRSIDEALKS